jgi:hypothetical protein
MADKKPAAPVSKADEPKIMPYQVFIHLFNNATGKEALLFEEYYKAYIKYFKNQLKK